MSKIMLVFGTRPEAIKLCPLVLELKKKKRIKIVVCVTAQHRQMLDSVLDFFGVSPDYDLNIMKVQQTLFDITTSALNGVKEVIEIEKPDLVLVHGDTSTTFAAALASYYLHVPVGHIEAGLRTYSIYNPFPEEFNRRAVSSIARFHFAPTKLNRKNLLKEGISPNDIFVTGNTVIDALKYTVTPDFRHPELEWVGGKKLVLITSHRRENIGEPMRHMFRAIKRVLNEHQECRAIYPIHMNPAVRELAREELEDCESIHIIEPLDTFEFHNFEARSFVCLTDSGGIQEECPNFGVPVLVMRDYTEREEGVEAGTLKLVGTEEETI